MEDWKKSRFSFGKFAIIDIMAWNIIVFESARGEKPVEEFIKFLDEPTIAKTTHIIDLLEKHGPYLSMPHSRRLTDNLYELRIRGRQEIRITYAFIKRDIYLLHAFKKQKQKTPSKEIDVALKRLNTLT